MEKRKIIILFLILGFVVGFVIYQIKIKPSGVKPWISEEKEEITKEEELVSLERAEKFNISGGGDFPVFTKEVIVDPFRVKEGEKQLFSIWAKDPQGIEKVIATITTDAEKEIIEFELVEGIDKEGKWIGSWTTKNISEKSTYPTEFRAINKTGEDTKITVYWQAEK